MSRAVTIATPLPQRPSAVLFDMDDTLVASERAWLRAAEDLWAESGGDAGGKGVLGGTVGHLLEQFLSDFPDADRRHADRRLRELLADHLEDALVPMPGATELLAKLSPRLPITIASNSPSSIVRQVVAAMNWGGLFTAALGTEDVAAPKPAPDLYLAAAGRCGVDITRCVVFEDSPLGAEAGRAAGAFVITVGGAAADGGHLNVDSLLDPRVVAWHPEAVR